MQAILEAHDPEPDRTVLEIRRITSYNVCYTKLLRAVEKGVRQVLDSGPVAGYPVHDVRVTVYDGKHHPVDSKEVAFIAAGKRAFMDAIGRNNFV